MREPLNCCPLVCFSILSAQDLLLGPAEGGGEDTDHCVGVSCDGFEGELMALLIIIEASHNQGEWVSNSKSANRGERELKRLSCSINYHSTGASSSRSRVKGVS